MLTSSLTTHVAGRQPWKACFLCMEFLPYCKEGAAVLGKLPERWSCRLLFLLQTEILSLGNTHWLFADTVPFIIYSRLPQHGPWMLSFYSNRHARSRTSARNSKSHSRALIWWQKWVLAYFFCWSCSLQPLWGSWCCGIHVALSCREAEPPLKSSNLASKSRANKLCKECWVVTWFPAGMGNIVLLETIFHGI